MKIFLIDGDGRAFIDRTTVARDPTTHRSRLLAMAPALTSLASVTYIGRPCYHELDDPACSPMYWTQNRYGPEVVKSLTRIAEQQSEVNESVLIVGYSGGGVLALLIAEQMQDRLVGVVSYGAPLDVTAWADFHGYTRLDDSLDPANHPEMYSKICQQHLFGSHDRVVPPELTAVWRWPVEQSITNIASDHKCCWSRPLLAAIERQIVACWANS